MILFIKDLDLVSKDSTHKEITIIKTVILSYTL